MKWNHPNYIFLAIFLLPFSLHSQFNRLTKVDWIVLPGEGLSNSFQVKMVLFNRKGEYRVVDDEDGYAIWERFQFKSNYPIRINKGIGFYNQMSQFSGIDSIRVEATSSNPNLNSVFYIPVKYCKSLETPLATIDYSAQTNLDWIMVMNTGERFPYDPKWAQLSLLKSVTDSRLLIEDNTVRLTAGEPITSTRIRLIEPTSGRLVCDQTVKVSFAKEVRLDYSGLNGRAGRNGQKGTRPSESGANGEAGEDGTNGKQITVFIEPLPIDSMGLHLLKVYAFSENRWRSYLADADGFSLIADVRGGDGGNGGNGGNGADASSTTDASSRDNGGTGGSGGYGGHAGDGGMVDVFILDGTPVTEEQIHANVIGGVAGRAGKAGSGGRNNVGLLEAMLTNGRESPGTVGLDGAYGRKGDYSGVRYLNEDAFRSELRKLGWR